MSPTLTTFLFEAANFLVLAALLGWLFFDPIRQALAARRARFEADAQEAADQLAAARQTKAEIDAAQANLHAELERLRIRELDAARQRAEQIVADARAAAEREYERSRQQAAHISQTERDQVAKAAAAAAAKTVEQLLTQIQSADLQSALVASACEQLRALSPASLVPVCVESSAPLSVESRAAIEGALGDSASSAEFRTAEDLGGGVRITTGQGLIDASVSGLARFAGQALTQELSHRTNNHNPLQSTNDA